MSTYLDLDDAAGPHPQAAAELAVLRAELETLRTAPRAESLSADFDGLTWTFQIAPDCRVSAGIYALVWVDSGELREGEK